MLDLDVVACETPSNVAAMGEYVTPSPKDARVLALPFMEGRGDVSYFFL